jgi:hypothetical protein
MRVQIKGRAIFDEAKSGQRIGQFKVGQDWDAVVLVLMDKDFETFEIYEAGREDVETALAESESSNRKRRGAISVARFKKIARLAWNREQGLVNDPAWDNQAGS